MIKHIWKTDEIYRYDIIARIQIRAKQLLELEKDRKLILISTPDIGVNTLGNFPRENKV
jgi:hypothetical protein